MSHPPQQQVPRSREVFPCNQLGAAPPLGRNPAAPALRNAVDATGSGSRTAEQLNTRSRSQSMVTPQHPMARPTAPRCPRWQQGQTLGGRIER